MGSSKDDDLLPLVQKPAASVQRKQAPRLRRIGMLGCCILFFLVFWCTTFSSLRIWRAVESPIAAPGKVLLVTAHPDDETIFFSPTISALKEQGSEVYLLCLTNGNAHGLGEIRLRELQQASRTFQIDDYHLIVLNHTSLQDGHHMDWNTSLIARLVRIVSIRLAIDTIITFDGQGITGHVNHKAISTGVGVYMDACKTVYDEDCPSAWQLVTAAQQLRKYGLMLDVLPSIVEARQQDVACYINRSVIRSFQAMTAYRTQMRWWTHVLFTRYTFVNTLKRL